MKSDGDGERLILSPSLLCENVSKQQLTNDPNQCSGDADPSDQKEQYPKSHSEGCMHEIEDGKERQDGSPFFRNAYGFQRNNTDDDPNDFLR